MKVRVIHHDESDFVTRDGGETMAFLNPDPSLHPFQKEREYVRALNATKMEKMFAKPFIGALQGHTDAVKCMARAHQQIVPLWSGSCDGEIRWWHTGTRKCTRSVRAHKGFVRGLVSSYDDRFLFSCGDDKTIKQWSAQEFGEQYTEPLEVLQTFHSVGMLTAIDHHWERGWLMTTGEVVDVWDVERSHPLHSFEWGCEVVLAGRFNQAERSLFGSCGSDNCVALYDVRQAMPVRKVQLKLRANALAWNPQSPMHFVIGNEDCNCYTFDMRKLNRAVNVHVDHVSPVLDVDFSPTGDEFVTASYDKTVRIYRSTEPTSREVYHGKRMQNVLCCSFSADRTYVFSGSQDGNVRMWKAQASRKVGVITSAEREAELYRDKLKEKYKHLKEIRRIALHKHVPRTIKYQQKERRNMREARTKKEVNRRKHSRPGAVPEVAIREKPIVQEIE